MSIAVRDWHDSAAYTPLLAGDRRCFAWEWLRRTPAYDEAWQAGAPPDPFGLLRLEDPTLDALAARPLWSACIDPAVLCAIGRAADDGDALDLANLGHLTTIMSGGDGVEYVLLSDGLRSVRFDLVASTSPWAPLSLTWHVKGVRDLERSVRALAQFNAIVGTGNFSRALHSPERRAHRWASMLRVHDAIAAGATNRDVVSALFGVSTAGPRWRLDAESLRLRVQRLAKGARACLAMGPQGWLANCDSGRGTRHICGG